MKKHPSVPIGALMLASKATPYLGLLIERDALKGCAETKLRSGYYRNEYGEVQRSEHEP